MRRPDTNNLKYIAIGFACFVIAMATLRTLGQLDLAPGVAGAIMLSVLIASGAEKRQIEKPDAA
jgi:uncharacterized membrane protein YccC